MKIVHICLGKANPNRMNGVNVVVHHLACAQQKNGIDVAVWGITRDPNAPTPPRSYGLELFSGRGRDFKIPKGMLAKIATLTTADRVHFHGVMTPVFWRIARHLKKRQIPWLISPHGAYNKASLRHGFWYKYPYITMFDRFLLRHAYAVQVGVKSEIAAVPCRAPIVAIKNGQNPIDFSSNGNNKTNTIFGYVGRLAMQQKGLDILLAGFAQYKQRGGHGVLWLVGDGRDRARLQRWVMRHGLQNDVVFHGAQFGDDKYSLLQQMDVFVLSSRWEVNPIAVMEAMAMAKPALISKATHMDCEVLRHDAGFVLAHNTQEEICQTMLEIDKNIVILTVKGQNAQNMIHADFSWDQQSKKYMQQLYTLKG